jgi:DNA-binding NtrC family response regulator
VASLLVIEDQAELHAQLMAMFRDRGYEVDGATSGPEAVDRLRERAYDLVLTDLRLGHDIDGLDLLEYIKERNPDTEVILMTAYGSVEDGVMAIQRGAYDYLTKPFREQEVLELTRRALERRASRITALEMPAVEERRADSEVEVIGRSTAMIGVMKLVAQVAPLDSTILLTGESGTGKDLIAQTIHQLSTRKAYPFVAVNCGAIPENLQESVLFGHARGSFTGAVQSTNGLFSQANAGTLFLDEIAETALMTQVKLLRFLQSGEVLRVGDNQPSNVDVRLVAATNQNLHQAIRERRFREDLFYRLNIISIELPPLRARSGDVDLLARHFLRRNATKLGVDVRDIAPEAVDVLQRHTWPGNVRELENAIERAVALARGPIITPDQLPPIGPHIPPPPEPPGYPDATDMLAVTRPPVSPSSVLPLREMERRHIQTAMEAFGGNRTKVSKALGISKSTLWRKLKELQ